MTIIRHKLIQDTLGHMVCGCGYDPFYLLDPEPLDWKGQTRAVLAHIKKSRRWFYLGLEFHYGIGYYIWESELTQKRWAIQEYDYLKLTGVSRNPRLQVSWTAPASGISA